MPHCFTFQAQGFPEHTSTCTKSLLLFLFVCTCTCMSFTHAHAHVDVRTAGAAELGKEVRAIYKRNP